MVQNFSPLFLRHVKTIAASKHPANEQMVVENTLHCTAGLHSNGGSFMEQRSPRTQPPGNDPQPLLSRVHVVCHDDPFFSISGAGSKILAHK